MLGFTLKRRRPYVNDLRSKTIIIIHDFVKRKAKTAEKDRLKSDKLFIISVILLLCKLHLIILIIKTEKKKEALYIFD